MLLFVCVVGYLGYIHTLMLCLVYTSDSLTDSHAHSHHRKQVLADQETDSSHRSLHAATAPAMKRADDGSSSSAGGGKRPRTATNEVEEEEEMELIDLTTDSPIAPPRPAAASASALSSAGAARPMEVVEVLDDDDSEEDEEEAEQYGDLFLGQISSKIVGIQHYTGIVSRVRYRGLDGGPDRYG